MPYQAHGFWVTWNPGSPGEAPLTQQGSNACRLVHPRTQRRGRTQLVGTAHTWQASCGQGVGQGHANLRHPVPLQQCVAGDAFPLLQHRQGQRSRARDHQPAQHNHRHLSLSRAQGCFSTVHTILVLGAPEQCLVGGWHPHRGLQFHQASYREEQRTVKRKQKGQIRYSSRAVGNSLQETLRELLVRTRNQMHRGCKVHGCLGSRCTCHQVCKDLPN